MSNFTIEIARDDLKKAKKLLTHSVNNKRLSEFVYLISTSSFLVLSKKNIKFKIKSEIEVKK